jgi:pyruvate carboxylase
VDFDAVAEQMKPFCPNPTMQDIIAYCLYPKVIEAFFAHRQEYSDVSAMDTPVFYNGLVPGGQTEVEIEEGKSTTPAAWSSS